MIIKSFIAFFFFLSSVYTRRLCLHLSGFLKSFPWLAKKTINQGKLFENAFNVEKTNTNFMLKFCFPIQYQTIEK